MRLAVFSPDGRFEERLQAPGRTIIYQPTIPGAESSHLREVDSALIDFTFLRLGTSDADFDEAGATDIVRHVAQDNRDLYVVLLAPPMLERFAHRIARVVSKILSGGQDAVAVLADPDHEMNEKLEEQLSLWEAELNAVNALQLTRGALLAGFDQNQERCMRRLLVDLDGATARSLGGFSSATTFIVECRKAGGNAPARVLKVGTAADIQREHERYFAHVANYLGASRFPHHQERDIWFAGPSGALRYSLVGGRNPRSLSEAMRAGPAIGAVRSLVDDALTPWMSMRRPYPRVLRQVVAEFLEDSLAQARRWWEEAGGTPECVEWNPIDWLEDVAGRTIAVSCEQARTHGDLHGDNVLVDGGGQAWLIDFYKAEERVAFFDLVYADVALLLYQSGNDRCACPVSASDLEVAEARYHGGGAALREELDLLRVQAVELAGPDSRALVEVARACSALRWLQYKSTAHEKAKTIAFMAARRARDVARGWDDAPRPEGLDF